MKKAQIIDLKESILEDNDADACLLRQELKEQKTCLLNLMSSPGSGKTSTLLALRPFFEGKIKWGVMEADIDSDVDANTLIAAGIPSIQLHTGGMCHLDADMTRQGMNAFDCQDLDFIVLENIGNLVCPAEFDTGAQINMTILSIPEGDDKPAKYPLMYQAADILVINKIDTMPVFDFRKEFVEQCARKQNPEIKIFYISAKTGEGMDDFAEYLLKQIHKVNNEE
ncbi:MAG: hydrogenase nickel incorporation protein HypB [Lachnospiraceae bacterium]|nr:hydrogenase nickel incorporation protein HypB [Lachnospiraceae bacterium]